MIKEDEFREDLYFRINTFEIRLPAAARTPPGHCPSWPGICSRGRRGGRSTQVAKLLTPEAIDALLEYDWPGNVRELANVMEHAYILAGGGADHAGTFAASMCCNGAPRDDQHHAGATSCPIRRRRRSPAVRGR